MNAELLAQLLLKVIEQAAEDCGADLDEVLKLIAQHYGFELIPYREDTNA